VIHSADVHSFIFSVNEKEKYKIKAGKEASAIYGGGDYYVIDFGQNDFYIPNNCDKTNDSFSEWGSVYETNGKTVEHFAGARNFTVKEIETYEVIA